MTIPRGWTTATLVTALILAMGFAATLAVNWPGHLSYDSILQLHQGRAGLYNNWHPPVMAWLMGSFDAIAPGAGLFVAFNAVLAFGALLSLALLRPVHGTWPAALVALGIVLSPQLLLYQGLVWKDVLFADSAVAGFVCLAQAAANWTDRRWRAGCLTGSFLLLSLAALTRQNGMILLPFAAAGLGWIAAKAGMSPIRAASLGAGFLVGAVVFALGVSALLNLRSDGNDGPGEQLRLLQVYDLAGAVAREPGLPLESLHDDDPALEHLIRTEGARLYTPVRNDPLASSPRMEAAMADSDPEAVGTQWKALILEHPWLYLRVRAAAFWWVFATPDIAACRPVFTGIEGPQKEMREMGLAPRRDARDGALETYGKAFFGTPIWSHVAFGLLAFAASFFAISIACDYRYLYALDLSALAALLYLAREPFWRTP